MIVEPLYELFFKPESFRRGSLASGTRGPQPDTMGPSEAIPST